MPSYAKTSDLKSVIGLNTWKFAEKVDIASWKSEVEILDIEKLSYSY